MSIKLRLIIMNFLQFAVWGAYLTSMGNYLGSVGLGPKIGLFYAMQGIVSIFMPAILGIVADRWIPAQRLLGISHLIAATFIIASGYYGMQAGETVEFATLFGFIPSVWLFICRPLLCLIQWLTVFWYRMGMIP